MDFSVAGRWSVVVLGAAFLLRASRLFMVLVGAAFLFLGTAYCASFAEITAGTLPNFYRLPPQTFTVEGVISSAVSKREKGRYSKRSFELAVRRIYYGKTPISHRDRVMVQLFIDGPGNYGDRVLLSGKFHRPYNFSQKGRFSYSEYLRRKGICWVLTVSKSGECRVLQTGQGNKIFSTIFNLRQRLRDVLRKYLYPNDEAAMETMLLGISSAIPRPIMNLFMQTGTVHILAISGLHVTMMAMLFFILLKVFPFSRVGQYILTITLLLGYAILTGGRPSVVRAFVMAAVFLSSYLVERESESLNSLALAALLLLLANPYNFFDVGFQLSFLCVLAILAVYPLFWGTKSAPALPGMFAKIIGIICRSLVFSLAIWMAVAGLLVYYFEMFSPVTVLANVVVVPLSSAVLVLGTGLMFSGLFLPILAPLFAACLQASLSSMVAITYFLTKIPFASFALADVPGWGIVLYYLIFGAGCYLLSEEKDQNAEKMP